MLYDHTLLKRTIVVADDLWLCPDCTIAEVNGDVSGIDTDDRVSAVWAGIGALCARHGGRLAPDFGRIDGDDDDDDGIREYMRGPCDACGEHGFTGHRFAVLASSYPRIVNRRRDATPPPTTATGYGRKLPTSLWVQLSHPDRRWRRVWVSCWSNAGTAWVVVGGVAWLVGAAGLDDEITLWTGGDGRPVRA